MKGLIKIFIIIYFKFFCIFVGFICKYDVNFIFNYIDIIFKKKEMKCFRLCMKENIGFLNNCLSLI